MTLSHHAVSCGADDVSAGGQKRVRSRGKPDLAAHRGGVSNRRGASDCASGAASLAARAVWRGSTLRKRKAVSFRHATNLIVVAA